jgi:hypothetical protein
LRDGRRDCAGGYGASPPRWEGLARFLPGRRGGCFTCMAYILIMVLAARAREDNEGLQQLSTRPPRRLPRSFRLRRGMARRRQPGRRRMGTVLALPASRPVGRTARQPSQPRGTGQGFRSSLLVAGVPATPDADRVARLLGIDQDQVTTSLPTTPGRSSNRQRPAVRRIRYMSICAGPRDRTGAAAGSYLPPKVWPTPTRPSLSPRPVVGPGPPLRFMSARSWANARLPASAGSPWRRTRFRRRSPADGDGYVCDGIPRQWVAVDGH